VGDVKRVARKKASKVIKGFNRLGTDVRGPLDADFQKPRQAFGGAKSALNVSPYMARRRFAYLRAGAETQYVKNENGN